MTDTDDLIRTAVHELVAAAPAPRPLNNSDAAPTVNPMERMVPVSMNDRTNPRRPTPAALGAVAAALAVVGGLWYVTSDGTDTDRGAGLDRPTGQSAVLPVPATSSEQTSSSIGESVTTTYVPPASPRISVLLPIPAGETELSDTEVLLLDDDRIVAVDVNATTARVVASAPDARRIAGVTTGSVVVEQCCDAGLVVASDGSAPLLTLELDLETQERTEQPVTDWRLASIQPTGGRVAAVVGTDLVISSLTDQTGTGRSLLDRDEETDEPLFGTVIDLGWSPNGANLLLIEEFGDEVTVHQVGGSTGTPGDRATVAKLDGIDKVELAGFGMDGSFAVAVHRRNVAQTEVQFFDQTTLRSVVRVDLTGRIEQVRSVADGSIVWIDDGVIRIRRPSGDLIDVALP